MIKEKVIETVKTIFSKETISFFANIAVIIAVIFGVYSWSQDYKLSRDTLEKQEQEKNMPPTIIVRPAIIGENGNFSILPTFYVKKNSNKHFAMTYYSIKIGRDVDINPLTGAIKSKMIPLYNIGSESHEILPNFTYEIEEGVFQTEKINFYLNLDYNPPIIDNYTVYNSGNKDIFIEYDVEIEDLDSQISYVGSVMTKINGSSVQPHYSKIYRPLKFNWINIGIQNKDDNMSPVERQKFYDINNRT